MKHLKMSIYLLLTAAIFTGCEKETTTLPESIETYKKIEGKESLGAMTAPTPITQGLFALYPWEDGYDIAVYDYNATNNDLSFIQFQGSTGFSNKFGFDFNNENGQVYLLAGTSSLRNLYAYDLQNNSSQFIDEIVSYNENSKPNDLTFGKNGILYFVFQSGEINAYNLSNKTMSPLANVPQNGGVGLTYDFDNNRLIYATGDSPIQLYGVDLGTGNVNNLFSFYAPYCQGTAQAIEYVGNNKCIVSSTYGCDIIYTVDLVLNSVELLATPTGSFTSIKDLMFINNTDMDGDGVLNEDDAHPNSDMSEFINIGGFYPNVKNKLVRNGSTMMDQIGDLINEINSLYNGSNYADLHRKFIMLLERKATDWRRNRLITNRERDAILRSAASASIPYYNNNED